MADDPVAFGGRGRQLLGRQGNAVLPQDDFMAGVDQRVCPALGQGAGDENAAT